MSKIISARIAAELPAHVSARLDRYAAENGRTWRAKLRDLWMSGQDCGALREARNMVGPSDLTHYKPRPVAPEPAPVAETVKPAQAERVRFQEERNGAIVRAFVGDRCLASAMMRRPYTNDALWTLSRSNGETVGTHNSMMGIRAALRSVALAYLAEIDAAKTQEPQGAPWYVECRTLRGDVVRRHGPYAYGSADLANAYHAEECAALGHNRMRRHDDESCQRVFRFAAPAPAPVAMVAQPVQQAQARARGVSPELVAAYRKWRAAGNGWAVPARDALTMARTELAPDPWAYAASMSAPAMVPQQAQQQQGRDMRAASPGPAPEILDVSELLARIEAVTGPAVSWKAPDAETPRVPLEPMHSSPVILLGGLAGILAAGFAFLIAYAA